MELVIETVSLNDVINSVLPLINPLAFKNHIKIKLSLGEECYVRADPQRLKQVLINLIGNAIKYNQKGGEVDIICECCAPGECVNKNGKIRVLIKDTGIGIKEEYLKEIFEPFHRITLRGEQVEGTGVGLSITRKMLKLMGGEIGCESRYGQGSTFWFELPADEMHHVLPAAADDSSQQPHCIPYAGTVLYIEDKPDNLMVVQGMLGSATQARLLSADTANEGITLARQHLPDLILLDIDLPDMDGFEALSVLKADSETSHIPVVAVSAHVMPDVIEKSQQSGFEAYITKPVKINELLDVIERLMPV
jgi:CheY-like chemotaxis protein